MGKFLDYLYEQMKKQPVLYEKDIMNAKQATLADLEIKTYLNKFRHQINNLDNLHRKDRLDKNQDYKGSLKIVIKSDATCHFLLRRISQYPQIF